MEPISTAMAAIAAVQKSVALIKAAHNAGKDVASLGALIGGYFDAKHQAVKAVKEAKKQGGSNLGKAVQIELQLKEQADFERQLKDLFFSSNNMDVWQNIQKRVAQMNEEDKEQERQQRIAERRAKRRAQEINEIMLALFAGVLLICLVGYGTWMIVDHCKQAQCGSK